MCCILHTAIGVSNPGATEPHVALWTIYRKKTLEKTLTLKARLYCSRNANLCGQNSKLMCFPLQLHWFLLLDHRFFDRCFVCSLVCWKAEKNYGSRHDEINNLFVFFCLWINKFQIMSMVEQLTMACVFFASKIDYNLWYLIQKKRKQKKLLEIVNVFICWINF